MQAVVRAADVQDRDGGVLLMAALFGLYPFLLKLYADSGYQGAKFRDGWIYQYIWQRSYQPRVTI